MLTFRPAIFDHHLLTFNVARVSKAPAESAHAVRERVLGLAAEEPDYRHCLWLLRACRERPRGRRAADECHEFAPPHSITSSARTRNNSGMVNPIAFAVLRLRTSSNFVTCSMGRSAGFAPFRILSTKYAAR